MAFRIVALTLFAAVLAVAPTLAHAEAGPGDSAVGSGTQCFEPCNESEYYGEVSFAIDAHSDPQGGSAQGSVSWGGNYGSPSSQFALQGTVTCLRVVGDVAVVGFTGEEFGGTGAIVPVAGFVRVTDGGGADTGLDSFQPAMFTFGELFGPPLPGPADCAVTIQPDEAWVNRTGDLIVTDAQPRPTSKAACKDGGWRTYGVFRNQGDCVSYVATGGRNSSGTS